MITRTTVAVVAKRWRLSLTRAPGHQSRLPELALFGLWLGCVLLLTAHHALWRDEVRALTIALQGDNLASFWVDLRGEGHPALWYLVLRALHGVVATPLVLPAASIGIAAAAVLLLLLYSPFSRWVLVLMLLGGLLLFEYSVMQRNYGITVLILFSIAIRYPKNRDHGVWLGCLLFLLANTNVHSVVLTGAFLLFWLMELLRVHGLRLSRPMTWFAVNAGIATLGVVVCALTVYPPYNDAVLSDGMRGDLSAILGHVLLTAGPFDLLSGFPAARWGGAPHWLFEGWLLFVSAALYGSLLGLLRSPGAVVAGLMALLGFSAFFTLIYSGGYRHEGLWLSFIITLYWITRTRAVPAPALPMRAPWLVSIGSAALVMLLALQVPPGLRAVAGVVLDRPPLSRSRDFGALIASRPDLQTAIVLGEPESLVEFVPYYAPNPTYMLRQSTFGSVVKFARSVKLDLSLGDLLATARSLSVAQDKAVLILMEPRLDADQPAHVVDDGYGRIFRITPDEVRDFLAATTLLKRFGPAQTDETFDVYLLDGPRQMGAR